MEIQNEFLEEEDFSEKKKLAELVFEKAKKESRRIAKTALANHIEAASTLNAKTLVRFYDRYIDEDNNKSITAMYNLDLAAEYIGYLSFAHFCENHSIQGKKKDEGGKKEPPVKASYWKKILIGGGFVSTLGLGAFGINKMNQPHCMYWKKTNYIVVDCNENLPSYINVEPYDKELLENFREIQVSDTTTFFEAGKAVVWYVKIDGKPEFYSSPGVHPISGKSLNEVTPYIINKYVLGKK